MIDLDKIEYYIYMTEQEQDEQFKKVMDRYLEVESDKIIKEMKEKGFINE